MRKSINIWISRKYGLKGCSGYSFSYIVCGYGRAYRKNVCVAALRFSLKRASNWWPVAARKVGCVSPPQFLLVKLFGWQQKICQFV